MNSSSPAQKPAPPPDSGKERGVLVSYRIIDGSVKAPAERWVTAFAKAAITPSCAFRDVRYGHLTCRFSRRNWFWSGVFHKAASAQSSGMATALMRRAVRASPQARRGCFRERKRTRRRVGGRFVPQALARLPPGWRSPSTALPLP